MLIAREKRKNNIAEYILYMWQLEDILRALRFDQALIQEILVKGFNSSPEVSKEILEWYLSLVSLMKSEKIEERGHLQVLKNLVNELQELHMLLLKRTEEADYISAFQKALPLIIELQTKQKSHSGNIVEISLHALYGYLLLRIQKKEIFEATEKSMQVITEFVSKLSAKYLQYEKGELEAD
jgi:hypothetical protein